jgi:enoyl-CoA hydratase
MAETASIRVEVHDGVAVATIDRPERRNALSKQAWSELQTAIAALDGDGDVEGLIVTGAGDQAFAAGADVEELADRPANVALDGFVQGVLLELEALPFPTIAAINGHALGGGGEVGFPEVGLGIIPGAGGTLRLLQHVGVGLAKEWILTGRLLDAAEAHALGLVNRLVEPGRALDEARSLMEVLTGQPRTAVRLAKLLIDATARGEASPAMERLAYTLTFHAPDRADRMHAFLERRAGKTGTNEDGGA